MRNLLDIKKHSNALARLIATVQLKEHGIECYFDNASAAISLGYSRSEILEALSKDISKTADDLFNSQAIIKSIKDNRVIEFDSMYNTVEDVFGATYNKEEKTITLSGVCFAIGGTGIASKAELGAMVLKSLFGIEKKELGAVLKTLGRYEETNDDVQKAVLYPSTILADEMIAKITDQEIAYTSFKRAMSYEEEQEFNKTFNRTGVDGVIQNSTYIDATGTKQLASSHKAKDAQELEFLITSGRLKYVEAIECDGDGSLEKMTALVKQIEKLKLNTKVKFTFKARKLGNLRAKGVFYPNQNIVAEDVRDTSAVLHELGHLIHMISHRDDTFVNYLINKLTPMIDMKNVQGILSRGEDYYYDPCEVVARACEIGGHFARKGNREAFADDAAFDLIKDEAYYTRQEGIYFNFTTFDETTKQELLALYELFYETAANDVRDSRYDNFIKIDSRYKKTAKKVSFVDMIAQMKKKKEKELKEIYSLVTSFTIEMIITNKGRASIEALSMAIITNLIYCGNHSEKGWPEEWALIIEEKAFVLSTLLSKLHVELSEKEMFLFLLEMRTSNAWTIIQRSILLGGFKSTKFRLKVRAALKANNSFYFEQAVELNTRMQKHPGALLTAEMLQDEEFVMDALALSPEVVAHIDASLVELSKLAKWNRQVLESREEGVNQYANYMINKALGNDIDFMDEYIAKNKMVITIAGDVYTNDALRMSAFLETNGFSYIYYIGDKLKDSVEFARAIVEKEPQRLDNFTDRVKAELAKAGEVDLVETEILKLNEAETSYRRKVAKKTEEVKILEFLAKDRNEEVRNAVASNPFTPIPLLVSFAKRKSEWTKRDVASNPSTHIEVLNVLLKESFAGDLDNLQAALARNSKMSFANLLKLAKGKNRWVGENILFNPKILNFESGKNIKLFREIVATVVGRDIEHFHYIMRTSTAFTPCFGLLKDMKENIDQYGIESGYVSSYLTLIDKLIESLPVETKVERRYVATVDIEIEDEIESADVIRAVDFDSIVKKAEVVEFNRTDGKGVELVLKVEDKLENFREFNNFMKQTKKGYYSRFAQGFILYEEFAKEYAGKIAKTATTAATVATVLYSADVLQVFASGTLF